MKNKIILIVSLIISLSSWSQTTIKTTTPCNDAMLMAIPGEWHQFNNISPGFMGLTAAQIQEGVKRLDVIHKLMQGIYPEFNGAIVADVNKTFQAEFAKQVRFEKKNDGSFEEVTVTRKPFPFFYYSCAIYPYFCTGPNEIHNLYGEAGGSGGIEININGGLSNFLGDCGGDYDEATIDGRRIKIKKTPAKIWKENELCFPSGAGGPASNEKFGSWCVLIHRKGMLPYIPVTKKQYLERALKYFPKLFYLDPKMIDMIPDKQQRDEQINQNTKLKNDVMKFYRDELDKVTKDGTLDEPAIVHGGIFSPSYDFSIFTTEEAGGNMLVTENPNYMRKDLPPYVPQFFFLSWSWQDYPSVIKFGKAINENFPIEKLQEMIDK
jgi:hypothetical protein